MLTIEVLYRFIKLHPIETTLISLATIITIITMILQFKSTNTQTDVLSAQTSRNKTTEINIIKNQPTNSASRQPSSIFVEVSGAVIEPDVYAVNPGTRLKDVLDMAGGLSEEADKRYVARNYNLSKFVGDQEKIYIPFTWDIVNGTFVEQKRILEYLQPLYATNTQYSSVRSNETNTNLTVSLNDSSVEELDTLPGIGPVTAQKIIDNRPYASVDELTSKKVVNQSTFDKIKNNITP